MSDSTPDGFYRDHHGNLARDRRKSTDRRRRRNETRDGDRRNEMRRETDRDFIEREHHRMIEDALEEFAAEHTD